MGSVPRSRGGLNELDIVPQSGDLIWLDLDPRSGREQSGRRPALVVSPALFWQAPRFLIVCLITSRVRPFPSNVVLPDGLAVAGEILTSHVRSIDTLARPFGLAGTSILPALLAEVRGKLATLTGIG